MNDDRKSKYLGIVNLFNQGLLEEAKNDLLKYISEYPNDFQALNILGVIYFQENKIDESEVEFKKALSLNKNYASAYNNLGLVLRAKSLTLEAIDNFRSAIELNQDYKEAYNNLGLAFKEINEIDEAIKVFEKALSIDPNYDQANYNLGSLYNEKNDNSKAIKFLSNCIKSNPNHYAAYINLGNTYSNLNNYDMAIKTFKNAIELDNKKIDAFFNLGNTLYNYGDLQKALKEYNNAYILDPDNELTLIRIGIIQKELGDREQGYNFFKKAVEINPNSNQANYQLGMMLYEDLDDIEAIKYLDKCDEYDADERLLICYYRTKNIKEFESRLLKIKQNKPNSRIIASLANHYAHNYEINNPYNFCNEPLEYIYQNKLKEIDIRRDLRNDLLKLINEISLSTRKSAVVVGGTQSTGNLLARNEEPFKKLKKLILGEISKYLLLHKDIDNNFFNNFPSDPHIKNSWFIKLTKGGHLNSHIHHYGWLSGAVYLQIPEVDESSIEGAFVAGINGENYPELKKSYPEKIIKVSTGDIVLFPSCLFHRTVPFESDEERICIAFDIGIKDVMFI